MRLIAETLRSIVQRNAQILRGKLWQVPSPIRNSGNACAAAVFLLRYRTTKRIIHLESGSNDATVDGAATMLARCIWLYSHFFHLKNRYGPIAANSIMISAIG